MRTVGAKATILIGLVFKLYEKTILLLLEV
jgi:hypothetical protein